MFGLVQRRQHGNKVAWLFEPVLPCTCTLSQAAQLPSAAAPLLAWPMPSSAARCTCTLLCRSVWPGAPFWWWWWWWWCVRASVRACVCGCAHLCVRACVCGHVF